MTLDDTSRACLRQPALLAAAIEFHAAPARWIHPDHLSRLGLPERGLLERLLASPRGARGLSEALTRRAELSAEGFFGFGETRFRVALLPFATLERLFGLAAAATLRDELRRVLDRTVRQRLEAAMGVEVFSFGAKEASLLPAPLIEELRREESGVTTVADPGSRLAERFRWHRARTLEACLAGAPAPLVQRMRLKLPSDWDADFSLPVTPARTEAAWSLARRLLATRIPEGGGPCFV
jgi:hypothetical protein